MFEATPTTTSSLLRGYFPAGRVHFGGIGPGSRVELSYRQLSEAAELDQQDAASLGQRTRTSKATKETGGRGR